MKIYELLAKPEAWTHSVNARDKHGNEVPPGYDEATCWCLMGAVHKCYPVSPDAIQALKKIDKETGGTLTHCWNDNPARTHAEVLALAKRLDI